MNITDQEIREASKAHYMQYDGEYDSIAVADKAYNEAAQWAIQKLRPEWIDIKDQQPEVGQFVLTYVPSIQMICRDQYREFETLGSKRDFVYRGVTHWMPLPEPPKQ